MTITAPAGSLPVNSNDARPPLGRALAELGYTLLATGRSAEEWAVAAGRGAAERDQATRIAERRGLSPNEFIRAVRDTLSDAGR